jgi:soluble cytochrome b562
MEITGFQIGFDALISLLSAVVGALAVWYSLKGKVEIQQVVLDNLASDMDDIKKHKKEGNILLHKRVDDLKAQVERNREKNDASLAELKTEMGAMELRIIQAIHASKK